MKMASTTIRNGEFPQPWTNYGRVSDTVPHGDRPDSGARHGVKALLDPRRVRIDSIGEGVTCLTKNGQEIPQRSDSIEHKFDALYTRP